MVDFPEVSKPPRLQAGEMDLPKKQRSLYSPKSIRQAGASLNLRGTSAKSRGDTEAKLIDRILKIGADAEKGSKNSLRKYLKKREKEEAHLILRYLELRESLLKNSTSAAEALDNMVEPFLAWTKGTVGATMKTVSSISDLEDENSPVTQLLLDINSYISYVDHVFAFASSVGNCAGTVAEGIYLKQHSKTLKELKAAAKERGHKDARLEEIIQKFELKLRTEKILFQRKALATAVDSGRMSMGTVGVLNDIFGFLSETGSTIFGFAMSGVIVAASTFGLIRGAIDYRALKAWRKQGIKQDTNRSIQRMRQLKRVRRSRQALKDKEAQRRWSQLSRRLRGCRTEAELVQKAAALGINFDEEVMTYVQQSLHRLFPDAEERLKRLSLRMREHDFSMQDLPGVNLRTHKDWRGALRCLAKLCEPSALMQQKLDKRLSSKQQEALHSILEELFKEEAVQATELKKELKALGLDHPDHDLSGYKTVKDLKGFFFQELQPFAVSSVQEEIRTSLTKRFLKGEVPTGLDKCLQAAYEEGAENAARLDTAIRRQLGSGADERLRAIRVLERAGLQLSDCASLRGRLYVSYPAFRQLILHTPAVRRELWAQYQSRHAFDPRGPVKLQQDFDALLKEALPDGKEVIDEARRKLSKIGLAVDKVPALSDPKQESYGQFLEKLEQAEVRSELIRHSEDIQRSKVQAVKQSLQSLLTWQRNLLLKRKSRSFGRTVATFTVGLLAITLGVIFKIVALSGVVITPAWVLLIPGLMFTTMGVSILFGGNFFFWRNEPNLFRSTYKGHGVKMHANAFLQQIREMLSNRTQVQERQVTAELDLVDPLRKEVQVLRRKLRRLEAAPEKYPELRNVIEQKMRALGGKRAFMARLDAVEEQINRHTQETDEKLQRLKETLQKRQAAEERAKDRVQKWQRKMHDAAWYDVMRQLNKTNNEADQVVSAIARGLLLDESFLDEETKMILKERMGIDLAALRKKHDDDSDEAQKEIEWAIKGFFAKSADSMLGFITRMEAVKKLRAQMGVYE